jgi:hypothetical protein
VKDGLFRTMSIIVGPLHIAIVLHWNSKGGDTDQRDPDVIRVQLHVNDQSIARGS